MCGIAGYIGWEQAEGIAALHRMADAQAHRGPDGEGYFMHGSAGLAHRRLAVIDRDGGVQPFHSADGRYAMVYNGEVYNYRELREELQSSGQEFATDSDTEVVLATWSRWGPRAFDRFDGMFALAILDSTTGEVVLARDQFGIKPLYFAQPVPGAAVFASELRGVLASGWIEPRPDDVTIYRYLQFRVHDDTERTFFAGIRRLMPGQLARISAGGEMSMSVYTSLYRDLEQLAASEKPYDEHARAYFQGTLSQAIRSRLVSDVPVGTALSGGLDSSTIVARIDDLLSQHDHDAESLGPRQQTFSAVFPGECNDEERYVDAVAADRPQLEVHKVHPTPATMLVDLLDFVESQEEPVISSGPYAQYCVMREASAQVRVMIDGQGADEMMAGYVPYFLVNVRHQRRLRHPCRALWELAASTDVLWHLGRRQLSDRARHRGGTPVGQLLDRQFAQRHADQRHDVNSEDLKARLADDLFRDSLPALLRYEDRNTARFSVEGRVPFLSQGLLRHLWSLDSSAIIGGGWNKRALRDAVASRLPLSIVQRRNKIGFTMPEDAWFPELRGVIEDVFRSDSFRDRGYFVQPKVLAAFSAYLRAESNTETMIFWRFLNLELWFRAFIDAGPASHAVAGGGLHRAESRG